MSTDGQTRVQTSTVAERLQPLGMMVAEPANGQPAEESPSDLRLLSVNYKIRNDLRRDLGELIGAEAHVGPDDDPQEVWRKLQQWVREQALPSEEQLNKLEETHIELREAIRRQQDAKDRLEDQILQFQRFLDRWMIPYPPGFRDELNDLPF